MRLSNILFSWPLRVAGAAAAMLGPQAVGGAKVEDKLLPDLSTHLNYAIESFRAGHLNTVIAHTDAILTPEIKVFIVLDSMDPQHGVRCRFAAAQAFSMWEGALDGDLHFIQSDSAARADVVLTFQAKAVTRGHAGAGKAHWQRTVRIFPDGEADSRLRADVEVRAFGFNNEPLPDQILTQITAHELGHVLGLKESPRVGDLMGPISMAKPVHEPTQAEADALREIRGQAMDLRRQTLLMALVNLTRV